MIINFELGEDIDEDFHSWYDCCMSLGVTPNINKFLAYVNYYGTFRNPRIPTD